MLLSSHERVMIMCRTKAAFHCKQCMPSIERVDKFLDTESSECISQDNDEIFYWRGCLVKKLRV